jgi:hypothetical protein
VRTAMWKLVLAAPFFREGAPGLHGVVVAVRGDWTAEPPAHCRLVSDHDLFETVVVLIVPPELWRQLGEDGRDKIRGSQQGA